MSVVTLPDIAKRLDPDGGVADIVEVLAQRNPIIEHAHAITGNLPTGHRFPVRHALPTVGLRDFNEGAAKSSSKVRTITEGCSLIEAYSDIDEELAKLNGNVAETRFTEDTAFVQAMNHKAVNLIFYGNPANDQKEFLGLANRYKSTTEPGYGENVVLPATAPTGNDCTSMYLVSWGEHDAFLITPKGSKAGLEINDKGLVDTQDASGNTYYVYRTQFKWKLGLGIRDYRQVVRCQFDLGAMGTGSYHQEVLDALIDAFTHLDNPMSGRLAWYCSRRMSAWLWKNATRITSGSTIARSELEDGRPIVRIMGVPVYMLDGLSNAEAAIS